MLSASLNPPQPPAALEREPADLRQDCPRWPATPIGHTGRVPVLLPQVPSSSLACWRKAEPLP